MARKEKVYDDDSLQVIKDDILRLQERFGMYIGYKGWRAFLHLIKEVLQNSIDEGGVVKMDEIFIDYTQKTKTIVIEDQGRGIPLGKIVDAATYIQSSGKFNKQAYGISAGLNGVGLTAANALSKYMIITVCRDGVKKQVKFEKGRVVSEKVLGKSSKTGTRIEFSPNEDVIGTANLDPNEILQLAEFMNYLSKIPIKVHISALGKDGDINKKFNSKNGIIDLLIKNAGKSQLINPIYFKSEIRNKQDELYMTIEVAMTYVSDATAENVTSFANYCTLLDHGTPLIGLKHGMTQALTKYIKNNCLTEKEKKELTITGDDCRVGWVCVINANHENPEFVGQVKEKLGNEDFVPFAREAANKAITKWVTENEKDAKKLGNFIKKCAKLRLEGQKIRKVSMAKSINFLTVDNRKFAAAENKKDLELYIVEGDSAGGTAKSARDRKNQAVLCLRGVPANTYGLSYLKVRENVELQMLADIMRTEIGPKFSLKKCPYTKIIIATDADIDGNRITSLLSTFFLCHMREVVERGMLYKVIPPLYRIKNGRHKGEFIETKKDYLEFMQKSITQNNVIKVKNKELSNKQIKELLDLNKHYMRALTKASNRTVVHPQILEIVLNNMGLSDTKLCNLINKRFEFLKAEKVKNKITISGVYNKQFQFAVIDDKLMDKTVELRNLIDVNKKFLGLEFNLNGTNVTIGELLKNFKDCEPVLQRFKGLGEMNQSDFWDTSMDPDKRNLIRLTSEDLENDIKNFAVLHSRNAKAVNERASLISKFKIDLEDIDN